jgi:fatty acid desaturase
VNANHPSNDRAGKSNSAKVVIRLVLFVALLVALWGLSSGQWTRVMPWLYIGLWIVVGVLAGAPLRRLVWTVNKTSLTLPPR